MKKQRRTKGKKLALKDLKPKQEQSVKGGGMKKVSKWEKAFGEKP